MKDKEKEREKSYLRQRDKATYSSLGAELDMNPLSHDEWPVL